MIAVTFSKPVFLYFKNNMLLLPAKCLSPTGDAPAQAPL
jgi:hypothetical protein